MAAETSGSYRKLVLGSILVVLVLALVVTNVRDALRHTAEPSDVRPAPPALASATKTELLPELIRLHEKFGQAHYSWHDEELFIREFFQDMRDGVFLDVGAYDYKADSNTYFLEKELGWSGLAVEAQARFKDDYVKNRPKTKFLPYFVTDQSGGVASFYIDLGDDRQSTGNKAAADERKRNLVEVKAPKITLNDLLDQEGVKQIDFMSMDIEQGEPFALRGFDIQRFKPKFVCIEATVPRVKEFVARYFARAGYVRLPTWSELDRYNEYYTTIELADALAKRYADQQTLERVDPAAEKPKSKSP